MYSLTVMKTISLKSRCPQGWLLLRALRGRISPIPLFSFGCDQQSLEFLGFRCISSAYAFIITCHSPCVPVFTQQSSYKQTSHVGLGFHPTQVPPHLKQLTSSMDLFSNKFTLQGAWVRASAYLFRGNSGQYITLGHRKMDTGFSYI